MKRFALVFVLAAFPFGGSPRGSANGADPWLGRDKGKHFVVSALIQSASFSVLRANGSDYRQASVAASGTTLGAGLFKEIRDRQRGGRFSWRDLAADVAGGAAGGVAVRQLEP